MTMILLDTHIWVWWVQGDGRIPPPMWGILESNEKYGLGVSIVSCLEVARLVAHGRLTIPLPIDQWIDDALKYPHMRLIELTPQIAIDSTRLPGVFHKDPCDRIIVATAMTLGWKIATVDRDILSYSAVSCI